MTTKTAYLPDLAEPPLDPDSPERVPPEAEPAEALIYPRLFTALEQVRWNLATDVPWESFERSRLSDEQALTVKMNAITEWAALPAVEMFLRDNRDDSDFSAFMSIWFFEEQKHSLVLLEYLRRFRPELTPTPAELHAVRFEFDPAPPLETLMLHYCGEVRLNHWYRRAAAWHDEPVIKAIYQLIARDEARHAGAYLQYMKRAVTRHGKRALAAFTRTALLMASAGRAGKPLHPTNLHVNRQLFPHDTVQSRLPDPSWLEHWLDRQIRFDQAWERKVIAAILRTMSVLLGERIETLTQLSRARRDLARQVEAVGAVAAGAGAP